MKRYRVVNRKRFMIFQIVSIILLAAIIFTGSLFIYNRLSLGDELYEENTIKVVDGDTLWSIANRLVENSNKSVDVRKVIYEIKELNNIDDSQIYPGDLIRIPEI